LNGAIIDGGCRERIAIAVAGSQESILDQAQTQSLSGCNREIDLPEMDSLAERDGFETSVPGERAYGLNLCLSPYELPFSARRCSAWRARTR
jgi:hypothetical protein